MRNKVGYRTKQLCFSYARLATQANTLSSSYSKGVGSVDKKSKILYPEMAVIILPGGD